MLKRALRLWWREARNDWRWSGVRLWVDAYRDMKAASLREQRGKRRPRALSTTPALQPFVPGAYYPLLAQSQMQAQQHASLQSALAAQSQMSPYGYQGLANIGLGSLNGLLGFPR